MEILDAIHRIDDEVAGRPLYLFLFLGERNLLLDAGCATTDVDPYLQTIAAIAALAPSELHGCHWPACGGPEVAFLDESRAYVQGVDGLVHTCFAEAPGGLTLGELIDRVNERLDEPWEPGLAQDLVYSLHGHAERQAVHAGRNSAGHIVYRPRTGP